MCSKPTHLWTTWHCWKMSTFGRIERGNCQLMVEFHYKAAPILKQTKTLACTQTKAGLKNTRTGTSTNTGRLVSTNVTNIVQLTVEQTNKNNLQQLFCDRSCLKMWQKSSTEKDSTSASSRPPFCVCGIYALGRSGYTAAFAVAEKGPHCYRSCSIRSGDVAQFVECQTSLPLRQILFPCAARDFSPCVNFQCRLLYSFRTAPVRNCMRWHLCAH